MCKYLKITLKFNPSHPDLLTSKLFEHDVLNPLKNASMPSLFVGVCVHACMSLLTPNVCSQLMLKGFRESTGSGDRGSSELPNMGIWK